MEAIGRFPFSFPAVSSRKDQVHVTRFALAWIPSPSCRNSARLASPVATPVGERRLSERDVSDAAAIGWLKQFWPSWKLRDDCGQRAVSRSQLRRARRCAADAFRDCGEREAAINRTDGRRTSGTADAYSALRQKSRAEISTSPCWRKFRKSARTRIDTCCPAYIAGRRFRVRANWPAKPEEVGNFHDSFRRQT